MKHILAVKSCEQCLSTKTKDASKNVTKKNFQK